MQCFGGPFWSCLGAVGIPAKKSQEWSNGNEQEAEAGNSISEWERDKKGEKKHVNLTDWNFFLMNFENHLLGWLWVITYGLNRS